MLLVIDKQRSVVMQIQADEFEGGTNLGVLDNGYPVVRSIDTAFPKEFFEIKTGVLGIPAEVEEGKFCYTKEKGFYPNPDWVEPKPYTQEQYDAVLESLIEEGRL